MRRFARSERPAPWGSGEISQAVIAQLAGGGALIAAWYGSSGQLLPAGQLGWLTLAVGGAVVSGAANAAWLLSGRRAIAARRTAVAWGYGAAFARLRVTPAPSEHSSDRRVTAVAVAGRSLYHQSECALVAQRATTPVDPTSTSRKPCGWCQP